MTGAALTRSWTSIPPPRVLPASPSLQTGRSYLRTYATHADRKKTRPIVGLDLQSERKTQEEDTNQLQGFSAEVLDERWGAEERKRRRLERTMLQSLKGDNPLKSRTDMADYDYEKYWAYVCNAARTQGIRNKRSQWKDARSKAVQALLKIHIAMDDATAQHQVSTSINEILEKPPPVAADISYTKTNSKRRIVAALSYQIRKLSARLELEKKYPPVAKHPGLFKDWYEDASAIFSGKGSFHRPTARGMWRRNDKIFALAKGDEGLRQKLEEQWKAEIHELESTLHEFNYHLEWHTLHGEGKTPRCAPKPPKVKHLDIERIMDEERATERIQHGDSSHAGRRIGIELSAHVAADVGSGAETKSNFATQTIVREQDFAIREAEQIIPRLEAMIDKRQSTTTRVRQQQLREIQQSVEQLKKFASAAESDGLGWEIAKKIQGLISDLEEGATVLAEMRLETDDQPMDAPTNPVIRWSNQNPNRTETEAVANVFGKSPKPQPIRAWPEPPPEASLPRSLSEQLKAQLSSRQVKIDDDLTVDVESKVPELQNHIFELSQRLKKDYPLMDTLPYDVWTSTHRMTLQTWLKILIWKWQTRNDDMTAESAEAAPNVSQDVRNLLDQMVLDHDLSPQAATRMAKRWAEVFVRKEERKLGVEPVAQEELDWDQMGAGMGWLMDEGGQGKTIKDEKPKPEEAYTLPSNLPFQWKGHKGQGYRMAAGNARKAAGANSLHTLSSRRQYSSWCTAKPPPPPQKAQEPTSPSQDDPQAHHSTPALPHITSSGAAHMVSVSTKPHTSRTAIATGTVHFSNAQPLALIRSASNKKGDVLSVSRIAGIMAAKRTPDLVPLCHPIALTHVGVTLHAFDHSRFGGIVVESKVQCVGQTGVEMEALTSVMGAALSVVDMCKAVDKGIKIDEVRVVLKEGGRSGTWKEVGWESKGDED